MNNDITRTNLLYRYSLIAIIGVSLLISGCKTDYKTPIGESITKHKDIMANCMLDPHGFDTEKYYDEIQTIEVSSCPADFVSAWNELVDATKYLATYVPQYDKHIMNAAGDTKNTVINDHGAKYLAAMKKIMDSVIKHDAKPVD